MNKPLLLLLGILLLAVASASAQQYEVYRVRGEASLVVKQQAKPLAKQQVLAPTDILSLAHRSEVKMFVRESQEMITLRGQCAGSIASLIEQQQNARQVMTPDYFNFVLSNLKGEGYNEGLQAGKSTTIYRDDSDSLFLSGPISEPELPDADIHMPALVLSPRLFAIPTMRMVAEPRLRKRLNVK